MRNFPLGYGEKQLDFQMLPAWVESELMVLLGRKSLSVLDGHEIGGLLYWSDFKWPYLDEWIAIFSVKGRYPITWDVDGGELFSSPATTVVSKKAQLAAGLLSVLERSALRSCYRWQFAGQVPMRADANLALTRDQITQFGLETEDLASSEELLWMQSMDSLRAVQKRFGIKGEKSKELLISRLTAEVSNEDLLASFGPLPWRVTSVVQSENAEWRWGQYCNFVGGVLVGVASAVFHTSELLEQMDAHGSVSWGSRPLECLRAGSAGDEPPCDRFDGKMLSGSKLECLPPHYPGCRCVLSLVPPPV